MVERHRKSHFQDLLAIAVDKNTEHKNGVAVSVLPSLMQRSDGLTVFEEGQAFSGIEQQGNAEACLTMVASPHVKAQLPKDSLLTVATEVLSRQVSVLEGMKDVAYVSPQVIVWWRNSEGQNQESTDELALYGLGEEDKQNFSEVISKQTTNAAQIIKRASGKPTIWGSWGHGTPEERTREGKSRGLPTNQYGHFHITHFNRDKQDISLQNDLSAVEKLNHFAPWNSLLHREFSSPIAHFLHIVTDQQDSVIETFSESVVRENGTSVENHGYKLSFPQPIAFNKAFKTLVQIAGEFEEFYQGMNTQYEDYYKNRANPSEMAKIKQEMIKEATTKGFNEEQAKGFASFIFAIKPTYGQLAYWENELSHTSGREEDLESITTMKKRYERARNIMGDDASKDRLSFALLRDTLAPPDSIRSIERTWPVHSTFSFIIDDYELQDGEVKVKSIKLLPSIASTEAGPEHIIGAVLKRS